MDRDYGQDQELAKQFFREVTYVNDEGDVVPKYKDELTRLANREELSLIVDMKDLERFNVGLAEAVAGNTLRYVQIFYQALDEILPSFRTRDVNDKDIMDVFIEQRNFISHRNQTASGQTSQGGGAMSQDAVQINGNINGAQIDINGMYPPELNRRAEISFKPASLESRPIRTVLADCIGKLVTVRGIVTRTTDVKPKIAVACYTCDQCGFESFQVIKGMDFTPLFECTSAVCKANKVQGRVTMHNRGSKFVKFQEIKLQEHSDQVPTGHIPRAITVYAHGEQTRRCAPGDHVSVSGVFLTMERSGFRLRTGGLSADTYIEAHYITQMNKTEDDELVVTAMSSDEAIELVRGKPNFIGKLSGSIAPEIYGHEDLKKALLLLLVGGVDRNPHGMKIRGNINICIMGDPGVAKSQLLGFIDRLAARSQYTTGRGSSGVGLTAAVMKDPITQELTLEGGALVLADEGICCIDEFDKMMDADRTAIHEVMEQQTVSIAKAGIMTTLNARVSILAAANPAYGRYNIHRTLVQNLDLPPALLSRFDLLWLIRDEADKAKDCELASHVMGIHFNPGQARTVDHDVIDMKTMRRYISLCKTIDPTVPRELEDRLVQIYLDIRSKGRVVGKDSLFTSPRSLLAIIRMSTALARLRLSDTVAKADVDEALRLYNCSRDSIEKFEGGHSVTTMVLNLIREYCEQQHTDTISETELSEMAQAKGLEKIDNALEALTAIESISIERGQIILIDTPMFS